MALTLRSLAIGVLLFAAPVAMSACFSGPSKEELQDQVPDLESENAALREQLDEAHTKASEAQGAASKAQDAAENVQDQTSRFSGENWRDVVPDAREAADDRRCGRRCG